MYLEVVVENESVVHDYIIELTKAGFDFDGIPGATDGCIQLFAFKDASILGLAYDAKEGVVYLEYQK